ncbi:hypothetical protein LTR28_000110, partial [Elasticomyces elasticus]
RCRRNITLFSVFTLGSAFLATRSRVAELQRKDGDLSVNPSRSGIVLFPGLSSSHAPRTAHRGRAFARSLARAHGVCAFVRVENVGLTSV